MSDTTTTITAAGRRLTVTATPDEYGRLVYKVANVGAFTVELDPNSYNRDDDSLYVRVTYGRVEGPATYRRDDQLPDKPVVFGVVLEGAAVVNVDGMDATKARCWLSVRRQGGGTAPDGTRNRVAEIVYALVTDWMARDDWEELRGYHNWHCAPGRKADHARDIERLNGEVAARLQQLVGHHRGYAAQAAILGETTPRPVRFPDPERREGGSGSPGGKINGFG